MQGLSIPKWPITINAFAWQIKYMKFSIYFFCVIPLFVGVMSLFFVPFKYSMHCNYQDSKSYNCNIYSTAIFSRRINQYNNVTKAILGKDQRKDLYYMEFVDINGKKTPCVFGWTNNSSSVNENIESFNKLFDAKKDFDDKFIPNWGWVITILISWSIPLLLISLINHFSNNYIYKRISSRRYKAVLKGKGIGKLSEMEQKALLQQVFGNEQQTQRQVPESSWDKNDRAFRERDVEDLTKQFYDDGK